MDVLAGLDDDRPRAVPPSWAAPEGLDGRWVRAERERDDGAADEAEDGAGAEGGASRLAAGGVGV